MMLPFQAIASLTGLIARLSLTQKELFKVMHFDLLAEEENYEDLLRALQRTNQFSIFFVECSPAQAQDIIKRIKKDVPNQIIDELLLTKAIDNLYDLIIDLPHRHQLNILFIQGIEKSLIEYIKPGYGGQGDYYKEDTVPRILGHLNLQRESFRDSFPLIRFVFLLPEFALKYFIRRAPDFFDWRSGTFKFSTEAKRLQQESSQILLDRDYEKYLALTPSERRKKLLDIQTFIVELFLEQGKLFYANGQYQEAIDSYDKAIQIKSDSHKAWNLQGDAIDKLGHHEEAIANYDKALQLKPDDHKVWNNRGNALNNLGRYEEAIANYNKALQLKSNYHKVWNNRGNALENLGHYQKAIDDYNKALQLKPDFHEAWNNRGNARKNLGYFKEAIEDYDKALQLKPDFHEAWYNRGVVLENLGRYEEAITSYDKALQLKPDFHEAWNNRGNALDNLGRFEKTIANYDKALQLKPDFHEAWNNRGVALENLGRYEEAIASYEKALQLKSDYSRARYNQSIAQEKSECRRKKRQRES